MFLQNLMLKKAYYLISVDLMLERLKVMRAINMQSQESNPEENALEKIIAFVKDTDLIDKSGVRLFGRKFYSLDQPKPYGYEFYLTLDESVNLSKDVVVQNIP